MLSCSFQLFVNWTDPIAVVLERKTAWFNELLYLQLECVHNWRCEKEITKSYHWKLKCTRYNMMIVFQYYCNTIYNSIRLYYNLESHTKWKDTDNEMSQCSCTLNQHLKWKDKNNHEMSILWYLTLFISLWIRASIVQNCEEEWGSHLLHSHQPSSPQMGYTNDCLH